MKRRSASITVCCFVTMFLSACTSATPVAKPRLEDYNLNYDTPVDPVLQAGIEAIDADLRGQLGMSSEEASVGVFDLRGLRLAMIHPDRIEYAASVAKIGILLAWFERNPAAASSLDPQTRHELGLMIKASSNEMGREILSATGPSRDPADSQFPRLL